MYISDYDNHLKHQVERSLDVAISEYAPGRSIVVCEEIESVFNNMLHQYKAKVTVDLKDKIKKYYKK